MSQPPGQKKVGRRTVSMPLCLNCKKNTEGCRFARGWMKSCQNQIWLKSTPLDRWWRQCSVICSEKSDRRELITREMIYSRIFIPCHSHQICAINELCGDRSIAKNLPKILTNSRLCLLLCNAVYKFQMPDLLWKVLPALFWCRPWRDSMLRLLSFILIVFVDRVLLMMQYISSVFPLNLSWTVKCVIPREDKMWTNRRSKKSVSTK